jgi:putative DNA primase/helicase
MAKAYRGIDLLQLKLPERREWLAPLICAGSLGMIYARPGIGKSYFCLWLAAALAGGRDFLKWSGGALARVLYIDGEMGIRELKERFAELNRREESELSKLNVTFVCPESFDNLITPFINETSGQQVYSRAMQNFDVLILDNYCSLTRPGKNESDQQMWAAVQPWLTGLRAQDKCVLLVHHAGKSGDQLGTSTKEFALDWCLNFYKPADYEDDQGARFNIRFAKGRFRGEEKEGFTAWYKTIDNKTEWTWQSAKEARVTQIRQMKAVGMNDRDVAQSLGLSLFTVKKILKEVDSDATPAAPDWATAEKDDDWF